MKKILCYHRELGAPMCTEHGVLFRDLDGLRRHHRSHKDDVSKEEWDLLVETVKDEKDKAEKLSEAELECKKSYWNFYPEEKSSNGVVYQDVILRQIPELPVKEGFQCRRCFTIFPNNKKVGSHRKDCGGEIVNVKAQTLLGGNASRMFRIQEVSSRQCSWVMRDLEVMEQCVETSDHVPEPRAMSAVVSTLRWAEQLAMMFLTIEQGHEMCRWRKVGNPRIENQLFKMVSSYIGKAKSIALQNVFVQTRNLGGRRIHLLLQEETVKKYTQDVTKLMYFIWNVEEKKGRYKQAPMSRQRGRTNWGRLGVGNEEVRKTMKRIENEERVGEDELEETIHSLAMDTLFSSKNKNTGIIPLFIACVSVKEDHGNVSGFRYANGVELSPVLAALLYFAQCVATQEVYGVGSKELSHEDVGKRWKELEGRIEDNHDCGMTYVRYCMGLCDNIRNTEISHVRFVVCMKHDQCGILDGHELSLETLGRTIRKKQTEMKELLDESLLFQFMKNLREPFWKEVQQLMDHYNDRSERFWFGNHKANKKIVDKWKEMFVAHLFSVGFIEDKETFDIVKARKFLDASGKFVRCMFWLLQVTSGGPARASELSIALVRNGQLSCRHLYMNQGRLMCVMNYHKGQAKLGGIGKPIARFPDKETSDLLLLYLLFVKPMEGMIVDRMGLAPNEVDKSRKDDGGQRDRKLNVGQDCYLFCNRGTQIRPNILLSSFTEIMKETGCAMTTRDYRQYHSGVVKNFINGMESVAALEEGTVAEALHTQSGHSTGTASGTYGVSQLDMRKLDGVKLEVYRRASFMWHKALGIGGEKKETGEKGVSALAGQDNISERKSVTRTATNCGNGDTMQEIGRKLGRLEEKLDIVMEWMNRRSDEGMEVEEKEEGCGLSQLSGRKKQKVCKEVEKGQLTISRDVALAALRRIIGDEQCSFRSVEQERSILKMCNSRTDGIIILPTGAGKSMMFMVPALVRPAEMCVVVVPLVALQHDIVKRCENVGIQAVLWEHRDTAGSRIVLCSCEHVVHDDYRSFVEEKAALGKLMAIFVEEAHLLKQWDSFRPVMENLRTKLRSNQSRGVPIYALSATCPPAMEGMLKRRIGMKEQCDVIRQCGSRRNIRYSVVKCLLGNLNFSVATALNKISESIKRVRSNESLDEADCDRVIAYCLTRKECDDMHYKCEIFKPTGFEMYKYHAGMDKESRKKQAAEWMKDSVHDRKILAKVMFATSAFGCGIDVPNVGFILHVRPPRSIMGYLQESGRGGRNGRACESMVIFAPGKEEEEDSGADTVEESNGKEDFEDRDEQHVERWSSRYRVDSLYGNIKSWILLKDGQCRRWILDKFNDGKATNQKCFERNMVPCDLCQSEEDWLKSKNGEIVSNKHVEEGKMYSGTITKIGGIVEEGVYGAEESVGSPFCANGGVYTQQEYQSPNSGKQCYQSQSQSVTPVRLRNLSKEFEALCAVCSVRDRKKTKHFYGQRDEQRRECFKARCLGCASGKHQVSQCYQTRFKAKDGWCHTCSFAFHASDVFHSEGTYGTRNCSNKNNIRIITMVFEDVHLRAEMKKAFPTSAAIEDNEQLIEWLRGKDKDGHTWVADVLEWIDAVVFRL